jgi:hypothetical protein
MGKLEKLVSKFAVQTAVYWDGSTINKYGESSFSTGVEIKVRWDGVTELIRNKQGKEVMSNAKILTNTDCNIEGWLYLGTLASLDTPQKSNPKLITNNAFEIQKIDKIPFVKSTDSFVRTIYL